MSFYTSRVFTGTVVAFVACLGAIQPAFARPLGQTNEQVISQVNVPQREGIPQLTTAEVRGKIVSISGDQVQVRTGTGSVVTYSISESEQERNELAVGDDVVLLVRNDTVVGINPAVTPSEPGAEVTSGAAGTVDQTGRSQSQSSQVTRQSQSSQVTRQAQTETQTTPAPRPVYQNNQNNQPVRGLW